MSLTQHLDPADLNRLRMECLRIALQEREHESVESSLEDRAGRLLDFVTGKSNDDLEFDLVKRASAAASEAFDQWLKSDENPLPSFHRVVCERVKSTITDAFRGTFGRSCFDDGAH